MWRPGESGDGEGTLPFFEGVFHDDPDGIVSPGETVRVRVGHSRSSESILAIIKGSLNTTGNLGTASNLFTQLIPSPPDPGYANSLGVPVGGSVHHVSHEFLNRPIFTLLVHPAYTITSGVEVLSFDWTAPPVAQPTEINFNWQPTTEYPNVRAIVRPYGHFNWAFLPTTYSGASLTVIPAPASLVLGATAVIASRRRR